MIGLSRREKFHAYNTLAAVPLLLIGKAVLIDMNNETSAAGKISNADGFMNITLEEVVFIDQKNMQYELENFLIPARNIRQIHIPNYIDIAFEINKFFTRTNQNKKNFKSKTFKTNRTVQRHNEILNQIRKKNEMKNY